MSCVVVCSGSCVVSFVEVVNLNVDNKILQPLLLSR